MKLKETLKKMFTKHVPLKVLAVVLAFVVAVIIHAV